MLHNSYVCIILFNLSEITCLKHLSIYSACWPGDAQTVILRHLSAVGRPICPPGAEAQECGGSKRQWGVPCCPTHAACAHDRWSHQLCGDWAQTHDQNQVSWAAYSLLQVPQQCTNVLIQFTWKLMKKKKPWRLYMVISNTLQCADVVCSCNWLAFSRKGSPITYYCFINWLHKVFVCKSTEPKNW